MTTTTIWTAVGADLRRTFSSPLSLVWIALICFPVYWVLSRDALFAYPLSAFGTAMSSPVSLALPLIAAAIYLLHFSRELQERFIVYARTRQGIVRYLTQKIIANAIAVFSVFFLYAAVSFVFTVWVAPESGWLQFDRAGYGANYASPGQFVRLSEAWDVSPALFGLIYAGWCGLNGVIWSSAALAAMLVLPNRFVALSLPFAACIVLTAGLSLLGLDIFSPYPLWVLFGYTQAAPWTALAPLGIVMIGTGVFLGGVLHRSPRLEQLR